MLAIFRDGVLLFSESGAMPAPALESLIEQIRKVDIEQVKKEIAARGSKKAEA